MYTSKQAAYSRPGFDVAVVKLVCAFAVFALNSGSNVVILDDLLDTIFLSRQLMTVNRWGAWCFYGHTSFLRKHWRSHSEPWKQIEHISAWTINHWTFVLDFRSAVSILSQSHANKYYFSGPPMTPPSTVHRLRHHANAFNTCTVI